MLTRRAAALVALVLCLAGCARSSSSSSSPSGESAAPSASATVSSTPSAPSETGSETVTGTIEAGVEPNCRLIKDSAGSHLLVFHDAALKSEATVGKKVTVTGRSEPKMMSTCQQGIPFVVASLSPA